MPRSTKRLQLLSVETHVPVRFLTRDDTLEKLPTLAGGAEGSARFRSMVEPVPAGRLGVMMAFGPGLSCELLLLRSGGWLSNGVAA